MVSQNCQKEAKIAERFTVKEKIVFSTLIYGFVLTAAYGIGLQSLPWAFGYLGFVFFALLVLAGYGMCSHCPYPYGEQPDCLAPPWGRIYRSIYKYRPGKFTLVDKILVFTYAIGTPLFPQFWLFKNVTVLVVFWILYLTFMGGFVFHICTRCKNLGCPFNRVPKNGCLRMSELLSGEQEKT